MTRSLCLALLAVFGSEGRARAATYTAASCDVADVQSAVANAADGDTVQVPAGSCTWSKVLTVAAGITLDGLCGATVSFASGGGLAVNADADASTVITGFTFENGFVNGASPIQITTTSAPFSAPFRLTSNQLNDDGQQGGPVTIVTVVGFGPGLIDHNTFTTAYGADEVVHLVGSGDPSNTAGWTNDVVPGGPDMIFLENNTFTNTDGTYQTSAEEAYYGAEFVFRDNALSFEGNDVHQGGLSGRWAEIYANTYAINGAQIPLANYWQFRGGSGVVYGNVASEAACCQDPYPSGQFGPDCPSSDTCTGSWPIPSQVGTGINETTNSPIYVWGNDGTIDGATQTIQSSLSYTNGTQAGSTPTSCTHPGGACDVVVTSAAPSSWVRCQSAADLTAGCPVSYVYTAYTYPHPLDDLPADCIGAGCRVCGGVSATTTGSVGTTTSMTSANATSSSTRGSSTSGATSTAGSSAATTGAASSTGGETSSGRSASSGSGPAMGVSSSAGSTGGTGFGSTSSGAGTTTFSSAGTTTGSAGSSANAKSPVAVSGGCGCVQNRGDTGWSWILAICLAAARLRRRGTRPRNRAS